MAILSLPAIKRFGDYSFDLAFNTLDRRSLFDLSVTTVAFPGARWLLSVTLPPMREDTGGEEWRAFFAELGGAAGRFHAGDGRQIVPRGTAAAVPGLPVVDGAGQSGAVLNMRGGDANAAAYLKIGDYVAFDLPSTDRSLHKLTAAAATDITGLAALAVAPPLTEAPADGAALMLSPAQCVMKLKDDSQGRVPVAKSGVYIVSFEAEEVRDGSLGT